MLKCFDAITVVMLLCICHSLNECTSIRTMQRWRSYRTSSNKRRVSIIRSFTVCIFLVLPSLHLFTIFNLSSITGIYLNSTNWLQTVMLMWYLMPLLLWLYFGMKYVTAFIFYACITLYNVLLCVPCFNFFNRGYCEFNFSLYKWNYLYYKTKL